MAQIEIERKPQRGMWPILLVLLVVAVIAVGVWYYMSTRNAGTAVDTDPAALPEEVGRAPDRARDRATPVLLIPVSGGETTYEA